MKKLFLLALLLAASSAFAQTSPQTQASFTWTVQGFAVVSSCQPLPPPTYPSCALPPPALGVPYTVILPTIGIKGPVTCSIASGSLPSGASIKTNATTNTSCEIDWPAPLATGNSTFTIGVVGS